MAKQLETPNLSPEDATNYAKWAILDEHVTAILITKQGDGTLTVTRTLKDA